MKAAVLSDTHLGDQDSKLAEGAQSPWYHELRRVIKVRTGGEPLDYLILSGDILDFSIASFEDACKAARPFFQALQSDKLAWQIVYIPGNHDKHVWDAVEWETRIIRKMKRYDDPLPFRRTQPALLDLLNERFELTNVHKVAGTDRWGSLFLEGLFKNKEHSLPINIAYPNLYVKTAKDNYLITHGHMLETAWVLLSEAFGDVKGLKELKPLSLGHLEEFNVPLTAMICTGVGQAGELSKICYEVEQEAKHHEAGRLREVLDKGIPGLARIFKLNFFKRFALRCLSNWVVTLVKEGSASSRYDKQFFTRSLVLERVLTFYHASCDQAKEMFDLDPPRKMIFGHTHEPHPVDAPYPPIESSDGSVLPTMYNTGGWLNKTKDGGDGPEMDPLVFFFDDDGELTSERISVRAGQPSGQGEVTR